MAAIHPGDPVGARSRGARCDRFEVGARKFWPVKQDRLQGRITE
jgi:hypothetical protein